MFDIGFAASAGAAQLAAAVVVVVTAQPFEVNDFVDFELGAEGGEVEGQQIGVVDDAKAALTAQSPTKRSSIWQQASSPVLFERRSA